MASPLGTDKAWAVWGKRSADAAIAAAFWNAPLLLVAWPTMLFAVCWVLAEKEVTTPKEMNQKKTRNEITFRRFFDETIPLDMARLRHEQGSWSNGEERRSNSNANVASSFLWRVDHFDSTPSRTKCDIYFLSLTIEASSLEQTDASF
jgi:hypothetical protein